MKKIEKIDYRKSVYGYKSGYKKCLTSEKNYKMETQRSYCIPRNCEVTQSTFNTHFKSQAGVNIGNQL